MNYDSWEGPGALSLRCCMSLRMTSVLHICTYVHTILQTFKTVMSQLEQNPAYPYYSHMATLIQTFKDIMSQLEQQRKSSSEGQDSMGLARRQLKKAEAIRSEMDGMDGMEGTWITFKVSGGGGGARHTVRMAEQPAENPQVGG